MSQYTRVPISLAVFGFNMLSDALRDLLDPRLRGSWDVSDFPLLTRSERLEIVAAWIVS